MKIDCIADLHGTFPELDGGDLLIIAGDCTSNDSFEGWQQFATWLSRQKYRKKIFIAGNHDNYLYDSRLMVMPLVGPQELTDVEILCDSGTEFEGLKIWGTPWSLIFDGISPHCMAFTGTEYQLGAKYALIPDDIDILISHAPFYGMLDQSRRTGILCGSRALRNAVDRIRPKLFVCGHIHEGYGQMNYIHAYAHNKTYCVNCSLMNEDYEFVNKPVRIEL